jgi:hypothetical protein
MQKHHREPITYTCPDIDNLIECKNYILKFTKNYQFINNIDDFKDIIYEIENVIYDFDIQLEKLRSCNDMLRNWGRSEAEEVDCLGNDIYDLKQKIAEMEDQNG